MKNLIAQIQIGPNGGFKGIGNSPLSSPTGSGITNLRSILSTAIGVLTIVAFIWFVFNFIIGAIGVMMSGGDKQSLENARKKIYYSIYGVVIVIAAVFIVDLIGSIFGIPFLDIEQLFSLVSGGATNP